MVTTDNYEEYMMLDADGELDSAGKEALLAFIAAHPALEEEYNAWKSLKLQPDAMQTYPDTRALLKQEPKRRTLNFRPYALAAAAAVLGAVMLIPALWKQDRTSPRIVHEFRQQSAAPQVSPTQHDLPATSVTRLPQHDHRGAGNQRRATEHLAQAGAAERIGPAGIQPQPVIALHPAAAPELGASTVIAPMPVQQQAATIPAPQPEHQESNLPRIVFAQENRAAFNVMKQAVEARITQASAVARSIKETALVIKLGNSSVNLNF